MSLDVYLSMPDATVETRCERIFIREEGQTRAISRAEWEQRHPGRQPVIVATGRPGEVYQANITHNVAPMAQAAGLYDVVWRPDEHGITQAWQLIEPLRAGLAALQRDPERYQRLNPANGWGSYAGLVAFIADYLAACERHPTAEVSVWR